MHLELVQNEFQVGQEALVKQFIGYVKNRPQGRFNSGSNMVDRQSVTYNTANNMAI